MADQYLVSGGATCSNGTSTFIESFAARPAARTTSLKRSGDGGRSWHQARLEHEAGAPFAWTFWEIVLDLPSGERDLAVRAWDSAGQTQPARPDETWNFKGYLSASWHRVRVEVA